MASISMTRRTAALVAAIVIAAVGALILLSYVQGIEDRAYEGVETDQVYQAKQLIPLGTPADSIIEQGLLVQATISKKFKAPTAITSLDQIKGKVAAADIFPQEQIIAERFVLPSEVSGRLPIPEGRQALTIEVGGPPGVGGFVKPDDRVSIIAQAEQQTGSTNAPVSTKIVKFLLQNIRVLAVDTRTVASAAAEANTEQTAEEQAADTNRVRLTVALTPRQAERAVYAILNGQIYFTLLPPGAKPADTPGRTARNIFR